MFYFYRYNFDSVFPIKVSFLLYLHKCSVYLIEGSFNKIMYLKHRYLLA